MKTLNIGLIVLLVAGVVRAGSAPNMPARYEASAIEFQANVYCSADEIVSGKPSYKNASVKVLPNSTAVEVRSGGQAVKVEGKKLVAIQCVDAKFAVTIDTEDDKNELVLDELTAPQLVAMARDPARKKFFAKVTESQRRMTSLFRREARSSIYITPVNVNGAKPAFAFTDFQAFHEVPICGENFIAIVKKAPEAGNRWLLNVSAIQGIETSENLVRVNAERDAFERAIDKQLKDQAGPGAK